MDLTHTSTSTENPANASALGGFRHARVPLWTLLLPVLAVGLLLLISSQLPDGRLHMWVLNVGQGDAILLKTPGGHVALVDGGPAATPLLEGIGNRIPFWQRNIDLVVLTHPHEDHMMGLVELLSHYRVGEVVETQFTATVGVQAEWLRAVKDRAVTVHYARRGETISFSDEPDLALHVLSPATPNAAVEGQGGDINNTSVVIKLDYGEEGVLLEGDAQLEAENAMLAYDASELRSAVLKVGHHGSNTSSSIPFLDDVRPRVAIISVGQPNRYGHPAQTTLDALSAVGAATYRTDRNGTVEIIAEKDKIWVRSDR